MQFYSKKSIIFIFLGLTLFTSLLLILQLFLVNGFVLLQNNPQAMDFLAFYTSGSLLLNHPHELYNLHQQLFLQQQIDPVIKPLHIFLPFLNPPFVAILLAPFAMLPLLSAYALWTCLNMLLLITILYLVIKQLSHVSIQAKIFSALGIVTFIPVLSSLLLGQLTFVTTLTLLLTWIFLKNGKEFRGGLMLSLLLIKPHFLLLPILALLFQRRWIILLGLLSGIIFLTLLSFLVVGMDGIHNYFLLLTSATTWNSGYGIDITAQHSLQTLLLIFMNTHNLESIRFLWIIAILFIIIPTLYLWTKRYVVDSPQFALQWALLLIATLLTSPHTHYHDLLFLLMVGLLTAEGVKKQKHSRMLFLIPIGYIISLAGYLSEIYSPVPTKLAWITIDVGFLLSYLLTLTIMLFRSSKKTGKKSNSP